MAKELYGMTPVRVWKAMADGKITAVSVALYGLIASYAMNNTRANPTQPRLAADLGCCQETISRNITRLINAGLLETTSKRRRGRRCNYFLPHHPTGGREVVIDAQDGDDNQ